MKKFDEFYFGLLSLPCFHDNHLEVALVKGR